MQIYQNKPNFPLNNVEMLEDALGGKDQFLYVNEEIGEQPAALLAENVFSKADNIDEPSQIIDSILGESYINIIAKVKLTISLNNLDYPIESKDKFIKNTKDLILFGLPMDVIADKLDYPIEKAEQILNRIKLIDQKLLEANTDLISNIEDGFAKQESKLDEDAGASVPPEQGEIPKADETTAPDKKSEEMTLRQKIKAIVEEGKDAYRSKEYEKAIEIYDSGLELDPDNTELNFLKKTVKAKIRDIAKAAGGAEEEKTVSTDITSEPKSEPVPEPIPEPESKVEPESGLSTGPSETAEAPGSESDIGTEVKATEEITEPPESAPSPAEASPPDPIGEATSDNSAVGSSFSVNDAKFDFDNNKIDKLEKKLEEKVKAIQNLTSRISELPEDACKSCEGTGECYWCKGSGKCSKCGGSAKSEDGEDCPECKATGSCHSCNGEGKCHWCQGSGKKKL
jgi:tetratricopeptide (TPR) repeat protein